MRIRVTGLPAAGLKVHDTISHESLNSRLCENTSNEGIEFIKPPLVDLSLVPTTGDTAHARGNIRVVYRQPCGRCLEVVDRSEDIALDFLVAPRPIVQDEESVDLDNLDDELGIVYYEGDLAELDDYLQETIILSLNVYWSPSSHDSGECTLCDKRFTADAKEAEPETVKLGDLLKAATAKAESNKSNKPDSKKKIKKKEVATNSGKTKTAKETH